MWSIDNYNIGIDMYQFENKRNIGKQKSVSKSDDGLSINQLFVRVQLRLSLTIYGQFLKPMPKNI